VKKIADDLHWHVARGAITVKRPESGGSRIARPRLNPITKSLQRLDRRSEGRNRDAASSGST